jgi:enamine deaminase RidA (YjgF/YER057c/UK114 family)
LANLEGIVERAGVTLRDAVKVNVYLKDFENFSAMNEIFEQYFGDSRPARTTVPADLAGFEVELDATFYREPS